MAGAPVLVLQIHLAAVPAAVLMATHSLLMASLVPTLAHARTVRAIQVSHVQIALEACRVSGAARASLGPTGMETLALAAAIACQI